MNDRYTRIKNWLGLTSAIQIPLLFCLVIFHILFLLNTSPSADEVGMYADAVNLAHKDRWPPLALLLWHAFNLIYPGWTLMLLLNLLTLWGACLLGMNIFRHSKLKFIFVLIPFFPTIYLESGFILKDTIISFGYMFLAMILAKKTLENKTLKIKETLFIAVLLFYYTMVKIQAQFFFPFMIGWMIYLQPSLLKNSIQNILFRFVCVTLGSFLFFVGMEKCNDIFVQKQTNTHYWQYVKIFDLAGISVYSEKMYVPEFLLINPNITVQDIEKSYEYLWEPLIKHKNSPLRKTQSDDERKYLLEQWWKGVREQPLAYLKHRARLWLKILYGSSVKGTFIEWAKTTAYSSLLIKISIVLQVFSFLTCLPISIYFCYLGARNFTKSSYSLPLFVLNGMALTLLLVLFVFSLAAAARYIYFSWCCFFFSIPFAFEVWKLRKQS